MPERSLHQPRLQHDPQIESVNMRDLVGMASAIEEQAVHRYGELIEHMKQRGEVATAAAFEVLLEHAREHAGAVQQRAAQLGQAIGPAEAYAARLPPSLSTSWDESIDSALLTPYRAFALAVDNRERGFAFYSYLAARAADPRVREEAEKLGTEQLRRAAVLRRFRRRAWHGEQRPVRLPDLTVSSPKALEEVLAQHEAAIASQYGALAARLRAIGDPQSAALLESMLPPSLDQAATARRSAAPAQVADRIDDHVARGRESIAEGGEDARTLLAGWAQGPAAGGATAGSVDQSSHLLVEAQKPLEAFSETLESIMRTSDGAMFERAAAAMGDVIARLARISLQVAHRQQIGRA